MVETAKGALDIGALKVAELKEELGKRGLPTNGLKKDLAERLREAIEADAKVEDIPPPLEEEVKEESAAAIEEEATQVEVVAQTGEPPIEPSVGEIDTSPKAIEVVQTPVEREQIEHADANDKEEIGTADAPIITAEADEKLKETESVVDEQGIEIDMKVTEDQPTTVEDTLANRMGERIAEAEVEEVELGVDPEIDVDVVATEAEAEADVVDIPSETDLNDVAMKDEEKKLTSYHPNGISPHNDPPLMLTQDEASSAKPLTDLDEESRKLIKPSKTVYVSGLVRPLTLPSFRAKMEEYGTLGDEDSLWLDGVKTHAYVTYQQIEAASKAIEDMSGTIYPPDTGREVQVEYIPQQIVKQCIFIEEIAWQEERGKMELRARKSDQDDSLIYSLHRQDGASIPQRVEPKAPLSQTLTHCVGLPPNRIQSGVGHHSGQARLEWGASSSSNNSYDRYRRGPLQDYSRRDYRNGAGPRGGFDSRNDRSGYDRADRRDADRGSSRADDRVREVEARILAERQRGERPMNHRDILQDRIRSPPYSNGRSYGSASIDKDRWSRDRDVPRRDGNYSQSSYNDRRREYSPPPPPRRNYAETDRDEFGRDRHRRN